MTRAILTVDSQRPLPRPSIFHFLRSHFPLEILNFPIGCGILFSSSTPLSINSSLFHETVPIVVHCTFSLC
ncbi:hypothetical protein Csa_009078 [Cucumis sativus]|uniref:Uncharacterized protein n=1 Tax=Cucumis sativus TaxID=3659 RepID=A0A0A0KRJ7_CUCSA|nr:hypothetical protein Csa_009078 [Cucumis sativus]